MQFRSNNDRQGMGGKFQNGRNQQKKHENNGGHYNYHNKNNENSIKEPIRKNCYTMSSITAERPESEVQQFMEQNEIALSATEFVRPIQTFSELEVDGYAMEPIKRNRFEKPTPIQAQSWPLALSGRDLVGIAQTGSGKTCAFVLPAVVHIKNQSAKQNGPRAVFLCPTRELCQQISEVAIQFAKSAQLKVATFYGGASRVNQLKELRYSPQIITATPGRLLDFIESGQVDVSGVSYLVLDEADRMLDMGFEPQIRQIIEGTRKDRQTLMFSATWPKEVYRLAEEFLGDYNKVNIGVEDIHANHQIEQNIHIVEQRDKIMKLTQLLDGIMQQKQNKTIIFVQTKRGAADLSRLLRGDRFPADEIHGDKSQSERDTALRDFKNGRTSILIATDVASRGLDIRDIRYVINFDYPNNSEDYVHRIGRTARSTDTGVAHSFLTREDSDKAKDLIKVLEEAGQDYPEELRTMSLNARGKKFSRYGGYEGRPKGNFGGRRDGGSSFGGGSSRNYAFGGQPAHKHKKF